MDKAMFKHKRQLILFILLIVLSIDIYAEDVLRPTFINDRPQIDGSLNEEFWKTSSKVEGFKTWDPDYGREMSGNTRVYMAYNDEYLYFAFECFDNKPDKIKTSITSRDNIINDDWVCINMDSFYDQQSFYAFYANPLGVQMDAVATGNSEDFSVDMVWNSNGKIDSSGYTVEFEIPFKSIRYTNSDTIQMGVIFERSISRTSEKGTFPFLNPDQGSNFYTQTIPIIYKNIAEYKLLEILPAVTYSSTYYNTNQENKTNDNTSELSLTTKHGITSDLIFEATINPDFSQVEADAGQVDFNVRYSPYYEEKRPFFLEGKEHFNFGSSYMSDPVRSVVHTRTIVNPIFGAKLTGKINNKNTISVLYSIDEPNMDQSDNNSQIGIVRHIYSLNEDSFIGVFFTVRTNDSLLSELLGVDGQLRISEASNWGFHGFLSNKSNSPKLFGKYDHAIGADYKYNTRKWDWSVRIRDLSNDFKTEVGYITRTGISKFQTALTRFIYPDSKIFQRFEILLVNHLAYDKQIKDWESYNGIYLGNKLPRSTYFRFGPAYSSEIYNNQLFDTSFIRATIQSQVTGNLFCRFDYKYSNKIRYVGEPYLGAGNTISMIFNFQPVKFYNSLLQMSYSDFYNNRDKEFDYSIINLTNTLQLSKKLFVRAILEYNTFRQQFTTDFLSSFTYIPGTVIHIGYGSLYDKIDNNSDKLHTSKYKANIRSLFLKASYLWRL